MRVTLDSEGRLQRIHPDAGERCNLDDADRVEEWSLTKVLVTVAEESLPLDVWDTTDRQYYESLVCKHCG